MLLQQSPIEERKKNASMNHILLLIIKKECKRDRVQSKSHKDFNRSTALPSRISIAK
jgi:hypothetical protein